MWPATPNRRLAAPCDVTRSNGSACGPVAGPGRLSSSTTTRSGSAQSRGARTTSRTGGAGPASNRGTRRNGGGRRRPSTNGPACPKRTAWRPRNSTARWSTGRWPAPRPTPCSKRGTDQPGQNGGRPGPGPLSGPVVTGGDGGSAASGAGLWRWDVGAGAGVGVVGDEAGRRPTTPRQPATQAELVQPGG